MLENKKIEFDTKKDLSKLNINRLFILQKSELNMIQHYMLNEQIYDKNDIYNCLQEIIAINMVISKKLKNGKK